MGGGNVHKWLDLGAWLGLGAPSILFMSFRNLLLFLSDQKGRRKEKKFPLP